MLKIPKCYNPTNIAQIAFRVVRIDFWAQFTPKIKLQFLILVLPPPCLNSKFASNTCHMTSAFKAACDFQPCQRSH
jgi:hypothetical protein